MTSEPQDQPPPLRQNAIYRDGAIYPAEPLELPNNTTIEITIEQTDSDTVSLKWRPLAARPLPPWLNRVINILKQPDTLLFALALLIYAATRLIRLPDFPIYFFSDEAIQSVLASDLIGDKFRDSSNGMLLPPYFKNYVSVISFSPP